MAESVDQYYYIHGEGVLYMQEVIGVDVPLIQFTGPYDSTEDAIEAIADECWHDREEIDRKGYKIFNIPARVSARTARS